MAKGDKKYFTNKTLGEVLVKNRCLSQHIEQGGTLRRESS
jgi:hypothetical protein